MKTRTDTITKVSLIDRIFFCFEITVLTITNVAIEIDYKLPAWSMVPVSALAMILFGIGLHLILKKKMLDDLVKYAPPTTQQPQSQQQRMG